MKFMKTLICLIISALLIIFLSACDETDYYSETDQDSNIITGAEYRFIRISNWPNYDIVYDKRTGIEYILSHTQDSYIFTELLHSDGTPYIYPKYGENDK